MNAYLPAARIEDRIEVVGFGPRQVELMDFTIEDGSTSRDEPRD